MVSDLLENPHPLCGTFPWWEAAFLQEWIQCMVKRLGLRFEDAGSSNIFDPPPPRGMLRLDDIRQEVVFNTADLGIIYHMGMSERFPYPDSHHG